MMTMGVAGREGIKQQLPTVDQHQLLEAVLLSVLL